MIHFQRCHALHKLILRKILSSKLFEEEEEEIREIAQRLLPEIKLIMIPHDLHAAGGIVEYLTEQITESRLPTRG